MNPSIFMCSGPGQRDCCRTGTFSIIIHRFFTSFSRRYLLFAPIFGWLGERADIIEWMRLTMLPCGALSLWCIYRLGKILYSKRVGLWAAICTGFYPAFFFTSNQFRPDDLWTALWLLLLVVLISGPQAFKRVFLCGLLLGTLVAISMKTFLMICALFIGVGTALGTRWIIDGKLAWRALPMRCFVLGMGGILVPTLVAGYFLCQGGLAAFLVLRPSA